MYCSRTRCSRITSWLMLRSSSHAYRHTRQPSNIHASYRAKPGNGSAGQDACGMCSQWHGQTGKDEPVAVGAARAEQSCASAAVQAELSPEAPSCRSVGKRLRQGGCGGAWRHARGQGVGIPRTGANQSLYHTGAACGGRALLLRRAGAAARAASRRLTGGLPGPHPRGRCPPCT